MTKLTKKPAAPEAAVVEGKNMVEPGQWWWYHKSGAPGVEIAKREPEPEDDDAWDDDAWDDDEVDPEPEPTEAPPRLVCVMHIGSNYIEVRSVWGRSWRVFTHEWLDYFTPAHDAEAHIAEQQEVHKDRVQALMAEVHEVTRRLGVGNQDMLGEAHQTEAIAVRGDTDYDRYKGELVKAKDQTLPELFRDIKYTNKALTHWLIAPTLPMTVMIADQDEVIGRVKNRVFNVELYSGLVEQVVQITDGEPATMGDKLHLFQRRHYMDEECLVAYRSGGMSYENLEDFDAWLAEPENRDRILPFPRCMVAFRVRRRDKQFTGYGLRAFIRFLFENDAQRDKQTFLYIRNGEQVYRLNTSIEFEHKLFPDLDQSVFNSGEVIWMRKDWRDFHFKTEAEIESLRAKYAEREAEWKVEYAAWKAEKEAWDALSNEEQEANEDNRPWISPSRPYDPVRLNEYKPFNPENIYYDDAVKHLSEEAEKYNRIALIIQGLYDRSEILHPHPPVKTWTPEGFAAAIELHYDQDRSLTTGDPPDFEAFRRKLNESLEEGSLTIGQEDAWDEHVNDKRDDSRRYVDYGRGPNTIAKIDKWQPRARKATFRWQERTNWGAENDYKSRKFVVEADKLLNVDAYKPGDFKQFFDDPRTRADYAKWAPMLLLAEEWHAGNVDEEGRAITAAANVCKHCGERWVRSHSCKG